MLILVGSRSNHGVLMTTTYWYVSLEQVGGGLTEVRAMEAVLKIY